MNHIKSKLISALVVVVGVIIYQAYIHDGPRQVIEDLDEAGMVVFTPKYVKSTITVFTDISCGYCVKLHRGIAQIVAGG